MQIIYARHVSALNDTDHEWGSRMSHTGMWYTGIYYASILAVYQVPTVVRLQPMVLTLQSSTSIRRILGGLVVNFVTSKVVFACASAPYRLFRAQKMARRNKRLACVCTIQRGSTREETVEPFSRDENEGMHLVVG